MNYVMRLNLKNDKIKVVHGDYKGYTPVFEYDTIQEAEANKFHDFTNFVMKIDGKYCRHFCFDA